MESGCNVNCIIVNNRFVGSQKFAWIELFDIDTHACKSSGTREKVFSIGINVLRQLTRKPR